MHRPSRIEPVVVGEIPRQTAGRPQIRVDDVLKQQRLRRRRRIRRRIARVGRALVLRERAGGRRRPLVEEADSASEHRAAGIIEEQSGADARRQVESIDHPVAIEARAEFHVPAIGRLQPVLGKQRQVGAVDLLRGRRR